MTEKCKEHFSYLLIQHKETFDMKANYQSMYLTQSAEDGTWLYTLPKVNRSIVDGPVKGQVVEGRQRYQRDEEGNYLQNSAKLEEQSTFKWHYIVLDSNLNDLQRGDILKEGYPPVVGVDVNADVLTVDWDFLS